ncbi:MAG TPA: nitrilase-related carbon-nitrogen hydrolase [Caldilineaceae bacterium]|nr:nitrilase-related carbon-nitrogen hydrolase [Caldilineaceae bacterium]
MDRLVVVSVQQRMHLPQTLDEYREDLRRFLRVAVAKQARLVVFPELGGVMIAPPILRDFRSSLLKWADRGHRRQATLWERFSGALAGTLAGVLRADFRTGLAALLDVAAADLWQAYLTVFGGLAREFGVVLVAPSAYLPDPVDGVIRNLTCVFSANGELVGRQAKVVLHPEDADLAQPGATWDVIQTEVGRLGLILGSDVLYPEVGRLLAYQGADMLIVQAACTNLALYHKLRAGVLARMQDNQLYALASFLVGENRLSRAQRTPFVGKSAIFAPQELTPRANGVLVEMGNLRSEGVLAAPWDFLALKELWEDSETPVRKQLPLAQAGQVLAQLYARLQALPRVVEPAQLADQDGEAARPADVLSLEDLSVLSSVTNRWPLLVERAQEETLQPVEEVTVDARPEEDTPPPPAPINGPAGAAASTGSFQAISGKTPEDETDEMDIIAKSVEPRD